MASEEDLAKNVSLFLRRLFKEYYSKSEIYIPRDFRLREYAASLWLQKTYIRHMAFTDTTKIKEFLSSNGPRHFYYSSARYMYPEAKNMEDKNWVSADIVFDIDADHLPNCSGKIVKVNGFFGEESFIARECINVALEEAIKLFDTLVEELGFSRNKIRLEFSGHRGFHVIVEDNEEWGKSGSDIRRELVNYLKAEMLQEETLFPRLFTGKSRKSSGIKQLPPFTSSPGLRGRLARIAVSLARRDGFDLTQVASSPQNFLAASYSQRDLYLKYVEKAKEHLSIHVDEQVTVDTKRLVRPWGSLHGKTGLKIELINTSRVDQDFQLYEQDSPFHALGYLRVKAYADTPVIDVLGYKIKLKKNNVYRFPGGIAVLLMCKGLVYPYRASEKKSH